MSAGRGFRVTFEARVVESFRGEWSPLDDVFHDPGVALDFVRHLRPTHGPTVVRARATGGLRSERVLVSGDWFCDDRGDANVAVPQPRWDHTEESARWAAALPAITAWELCSRLPWLLEVAADVGVDRRVVTRCACACARTALGRLRRPDPRFVRALSVAEAWCDGEATIQEVSRAAASADDALQSATSEGTFAAGSAASFAAMVPGAGRDPDGTVWTSDPDHGAGIAAGYAAMYAVGNIPSGGEVIAVLREEDEVALLATARSLIPTITFLRAACAVHSSEVE